MQAQPWWHAYEHDGRLVLCLSDLPVAFPFVLVCLFAAVAVTLLVRTAYDLKFPVVVGHYAEDARNKTVWMIVGLATSLAALVAYFVSDRIAPQMTQVLVLLRLAIGFAGFVIFARSLLRMQTSMYRPLGAMTVADAESDTHYATVGEIQLAPVVIPPEADRFEDQPAPPMNPRRWARTNLHGVAIGLLLLAVALFGWQANGMCV